MGEVINGKPVWDLGQIVENFERRHISWGDAPTVTYAFATHSPDTNSTGFQSFSSIEEQFTRAAFALVSDIADISFVEGVDNGHDPGGDNADILLGADQLDPAFAGLTGVDATNGQLNGALVVLSIDEMAKRSWITGGFDFYTLIHEVLHALGLPHPGDYNAGDSTPPTYEASAEYYQDSRQYSVMSYFAGAKTGANFTTVNENGDTLLWSAATPLLHDVAALQAIYGANMSTRAGDTTYGFHSTAGRPSYDFTVNVHPIVCLWDGGGQDTLDCSGFTSDQHIDLHAGAFSDVGGFTGNVSIAYGCDIENAVGGSGADRLTGDDLDNTLAGGLGADTFDGGAGQDAVTYAAAGGAVTVNLGLGKASGADGADTLISIETLVGSAFNDALFGGTGDDRLFGGAGVDRLNGGAGNDLLDGGPGIDTLTGAAGDDTVTYQAARTRVGVDLGAGIANGGGGLDVLVSVESVIGTDFDDSLRGSGTVNTLIGGAGDDTVDGRGGADRLDGGAGEDTVRFAFAKASVIADLGAGTATVGDVGVMLIGFENLSGGRMGDVLGGDGGVNRIGGAGGADSLAGGAGDDLLDGGMGADTLTGGAGADSFVFDRVRDAGPRHADLITDLDAADHIDLSAIDADATQGGDQAFSIVAAFDGHAGELTLAYDAASDRTLIRMDVDGDSRADMLIEVAGDHHDVAGLIL